MSPTLAVLNTSAFSPDGKFIAAGRNIFNVVLIYDARTAQFKKALLGDEKQASDTIAQSLSISKDSKYIAAAGIDDTIVVWDFSDDQIKMRLTDCKGAIAVSFSPNENILVASCPENNVTLWTVPDGNMVGELAGHSAPVLSIAFSPDGALLATGGADKMVRIWKIETLQPISTYAPTSYPIHSLSFTPDGSSLAIYSGNLKIWRWADGEVKDVAIPEPKSSSLHAVGALASSIASARSMQLGGGPLGLVSFSGPESVVQTIQQRLPMSFSPDGNILALLRYNPSWGGDYELVLHDITTGKNSIIPTKGRSFSFSPEGNVIAIVGSFGVSESVRLFDPVNAKWIQTDK